MSHSVCTNGLASAAGSAKPSSAFCDCSARELSEFSAEPESVNEVPVGWVRKNAAYAGANVFACHASARNRFQSIMMLPTTRQASVSKFEPLYGDPSQFDSLGASIVVVLHALGKNCRAAVTALRQNCALA